MRTEVPGRVDWSVAAERLCFLYPPVIGVGAIGVVEELDPGVPGLALGLVLFASVGYTALTVGLMTVVFLDARAVRRTGRWRPSPLWNGLAAGILPPVAGPVYLHRRYGRLGVPETWNGWWIVVAVSLLATLVGTVGAVAGLLFVLPGLVVTSAGMAAAIAFGTFPIAIHQDAAHVSARPGGWAPNPGGYLGLAFLSLAVPPIQPVLATYYLVRRRRAIGFRFPALPGR